VIEPSLLEVSAVVGVVVAAGAWRTLREPAEVALAASGLVTRSRLGRRRETPWASITELVCHPEPERPRRVRIVASSGHVRLSDRTSGFSTLFAEIRSRAPGALLTKSTLFRR
jgi:hypothetical protein